MQSYVLRFQFVHLYAIIKLLNFKIILIRVKNMNLDFELNLSQQQKLVMTQQMQMSIKMLQMSSIELNEYVEREMEENPLLEKQYTENGQEEVINKENNFNDKIDYDKFMKYLNFEDYKHENNYKGEEEISPFNFISKEESLREYLMTQLGEIQIKNSQKKVCEYIIENLDEKGYLPDSVSDIAEQLNVNEDEVTSSLKIVQSFEPDGIGAQNLEECLKLQLKKKNIYDENLFYIIDNHLTNIAENKYNVIAKDLNINPKEAQEYGDVIKKLEPKPSRGFYTGDETKFIFPDAFVKKLDGEFFIIMNDNSIPTLSINNVYKTIISSNSNKDKDAEEYVKNKINSAVFLIKSIEQRKSTLYSVLKEIVDYQKDYFNNGIKYLKPMTLKDIADKIEIHESTVSRAIREKYIYTDRGIVKIKDLFTTGISSENSSSDSMSSSSVKTKIKELVENENARNPLSDQKICDVLNSQGMNISRRTVAKYREEMNIKSSSKRKRY